MKNSKHAALSFLRKPITDKYGTYLQ